MPKPESKIIRLKSYRTLARKINRKTSQKIGQKIGQNSYPNAAPHFSRKVYRILRRNLLPLVVIFLVAGAAFFNEERAVSGAGDAPTIDGSTIYVVDGDTLRIGRERVRLLDLDTPEMRGRCPEETAMAHRARDYLRDLLSGRSVTLERHGTDRYGRTLAYVYADGRNVSQLLIRAGLGRDYGRGRRPWCTST